MAANGRNRVPGRGDDALALRSVHRVAVVVGEGTFTELDPRRDVRTHTDLSLFPNVVNDLRDVPLADLVPRGYGDHVEIIGACHSGGTTGASKRVLLLSDWFTQLLSLKSARMDAVGASARGELTHACADRAAHLGRLMAELPRVHGGIGFSVDLDPRRCGAARTRGLTTEASRDASTWWIRPSPFSCIRKSACSW